jgi:hypothetical protein
MLGTREDAGQGLRGRQSGRNSRLAGTEGEFARYFYGPCTEGWIHVDSSHDHTLVERAQAGDARKHRHATSRARGKGQRQGQDPRRGNVRYTAFGLFLSLWLVCY